MKVEIYGASWCQPCKKTKQLCVEKGLDYTFNDVSAEPKYKAECEQRLGHTISTIPQVFVDGKHVGGADEFRNYVK